MAKVTQDQKEAMLKKRLGLSEFDGEEMVADELRKVIKAHHDISVAVEEKQPIEMIGWRKILAEMDPYDASIFWYVAWEYIYNHNLEELKISLEN